MINFTGHTIGRYKILESIGQGGMAVVYKALDTRLDNEVALKFINKYEFPASAQGTMLDRFEREAKIMASLNHPNIVKVMDYGEYEGYPYLVMPYLAGGTLKARMGTPIPWREAMRIILPLTQALSYAHKHQKGGLHRDIKPSNILMTDGNEPVLTDFGIAKILENDKQHTLTGTGTGMGTPEYMAPEQWLSKDVDGRADLYALGVVMYEMLTGRQPYKADTPAGVMLKQATEPLPRPGMFVAGLPENVERVVLKAMTKDAKDRFQSMEEFGMALKSLTAEPNPIPLPKWVKPVLIGLLGIGLLASFIVWLVIPGIGRIQAYAVEHGETATVQAGLLATESKNANQTAIAAEWTATPSKTPTPSATLSPSATPTYTPNPSPSPKTTLAVTVDPNVPPACTEIGQEWVSPIDGMTLVCVPAGEFIMGATDEEIKQLQQVVTQSYYDSQLETEKPLHTVYLDAYWMDQTEVTNAQYRQCVADGVCGMPLQQNGRIFSGYRPSDYFINSEYADYPVIYVNIDKAVTYCEWAGRELPTEAQWEKAARGTDGRTYPWGNEINSIYANYDSDGTTAVGSYPKGASPFGAWDMAGNVEEWTADGYYAYPSDYQVEPAGSETNYRVLRGGRYFSTYYQVRSSWRRIIQPYAFSGGGGKPRLGIYFELVAGTQDNIGFRCSLSLP